MPARVLEQRAKNMSGSSRPTTAVQHGGSTELPPHFLISPTFPPSYFRGNNESALLSTKVRETEAEMFIASA